MLPRASHRARLKPNQHSTILNAMTTIATPEKPLAEVPPRPLDRVAIIIRDDAFDRLLTPLTFAWELGRAGVEVDVLFVLWAVRVLTPEGAAKARIDPRHADEEDWLRERLQRDGDPLEIRDFLALLKTTGHVRLHGCRLAAQTFDVTPKTLLPEADGIIDPGEFLRTIVSRADHCQYF